MNELEQQNKILKVICGYLLYERKQETQLRIAFSILAQERHNQFHTNGMNHKIGDGTDFSECSNDLCTAAYNILKEGRSMAVEINDLTIQMVAGFKFTIRKEGQCVRAWLEEGKIEEVSNLVLPV
jgi:hypothetical protein